MSKHDLLLTISPYLDPHLLLEIILFEQQKANSNYDRQQLIGTKLAILSKTNMIDLAIEVYESELQQTPPEELFAQKQKVLDQLKQNRELNERIASVLGDDEARKLIEEHLERQQLDLLLRELKEKFGFDGEMLDSMQTIAKAHYDAGNYERCLSLLYHFIMLTTNQEKKFSALWGKFSSEIILGNYETALADMNRLKDAIDGKNSFSALEQLQQRTWLIHWSLFLFFNYKEGQEKIIELFLRSAHYSNAIQTVCPHILRYLTASLIMAPHRRAELNELVRIIQQETYSYRDPLTEFIECLYVNFDFDAAQQKLRECEEVLDNDFFLSKCKNEFMEASRLFVFETYCRIHNTISISMLGEKLGLPSQEAAEEWIVNLIRTAHLDATIDSKEGHVVMATQVPSVYHQVIEKTKASSWRSTTLLNYLDKQSKNATRNASKQQQPHSKEEEA